MSELGLVIYHCLVYHWFKGKKLCFIIWIFYLVLMTQNYRSDVPLSLLSCSMDKTLIIWRPETLNEQDDEEVETLWTEYARLGEVKQMSLIFFLVFALIRIFRLAGIPWASLGVSGLLAQVTANLEWRVSVSTGRSTSGRKMEKVTGFSSPKCPWVGEDTLKPSRTLAGRPTEGKYN